MSGQPVPSPIPPSKLAYSGTPFVITTGSETVPTDFPVVVLSFTGNFSMGGTPALAPGLYIGQRLLTLPASGATGYLEWVIHAGGVEKPVLSPIIQNAYGVNYAEAIDWVWDGTGWGLVSVFHPGQVTIDGDTITGDIPGANAITANGPLTAGTTFITAVVSVVDPNPVNTVTIALSHVDITLTTGPITLGGTPNLSPGATEGQLLYLGNSPASTFDLKLEGEIFLPGGGLFLHTPKLTLKPGDLVVLKWWGTAWREVGRSVQAPTVAPSLVDGPGLSLPPEAETLLVEVSSTETLGSPNIINGDWDNQEVFIQSDPDLSVANVTLEDESVNATSQLRLATGSLVLTPGSSLKVRWNAATSKWYEIHRTVLV